MNLIAETAWHHEGDFEFFKDLVINLTSKTKSDYIKFHILLDVDKYMHSDHHGYEATKKAIFDEHQWEEIINTANSNNKKIMLLFNDKKAIDFGMGYQPELVEIHSVCLNDIKLLKHLKDKVEENTKIVLGVGGSSLYEIENAIQLLENENIVLMHGFQNYPTKYQDINFSKVKRIMQLFPEFEHGYADHTAWNNENNILITLLGAAMGMNYIEKHVTIKPGEERVDWQAAISIEMFNELKEKADLLIKSFGNGLLELNEAEKAYSVFGPMKKAAILNRGVKKGELLQEEIVDFKRTNQQSDLSQLDILAAINKKFTDDLKKGHCIISKDLEK